MKKGACSFADLSFSKLFQAYTNSYDQLSGFYSGNPTSFSDVERHASGINPQDRSKEIDALRAYQSELGLSDLQSENLNQLHTPDALTIVTGQQLGLYGGPVFTIYKTITAIKLARQYSKKLNRPVIPVFWLADEDHDFEEIAWFAAPGNEDRDSTTLPEDETGKPVADVVLGDELETFRKKVQEINFETDFSADFWALLDECYQKGETHGRAFAHLIDRLFSKHGVVIAGSNFSEIKELCKGAFKQSISKINAQNASLKEQTEKLAGQFHQQVMLGSSNLFYMDDANGRVKIEWNDDSWNIEGKGRFSEEELLSLIDSNPQNFSPNVFMRPIIQDKILPTLGYVAGPGELAYYGQMKSFYPHFDLTMPIIFPRLSGSLIESGIERIMEKLPFGFCEYAKRIEDLESDFVDKTEQHDIEAIFNNWKKNVEELSKEPIAQINEIEPTLESAADKVTSIFGNELDKLKGKVYRSVKQQEETQLKRIRKIKAQLFPDGGLQERSISFAYFMNKYGMDIWDELLADFEEEDLELSKHHIFYL